MSTKNQSKYNKPKYTYLNSDEVITISVNGNSTTTTLGNVVVNYQGQRTNLSVRISQEQQFELMRKKLDDAERQSKRDKDELDRLRKLVKQDETVVNPTTITSSNWSDAV